MGPTKRARPSFSPPRPGKSKSNKSTTSTLKKQKAATTARKILNESHKRKASRQELSDDERSDNDEEEIRPRSKSKSKNKSNARSFIMDEASDEDEDPDEEEDEDEDDDPEASTFISRPGDSASPEPDMILAEIEVAQPSQSPIPEALVHKMLSHHFTKGEGVKMSRDARDLVTKYIEVFVREAIMRSAYERQEMEKDGGGGGGGFLEVEDLERAAVQLCLDF